MTDSQYNASLTIFFISYSVFEPLTNVLLKRIRLSLFIPSLSFFGYGICMTTMGLVHNFAGLMAAQWFLGLAEAGLFPVVATFFHAGTKGQNSAFRWPYSSHAAALAGSFGGLLAATIVRMDGIGGKDGRAWIFILGGFAAVVIGIISYWMVYDFPDKATFLSDVERKRVLRRLALDRQSSTAQEHKWKSSYLWDSLTDYKTWLGAIIYMGIDGALYAFSLFVPSIIRELRPGYSSTLAQLLSMAPYDCAAILTVAVGYLADRTRQRGLCNIFISALGIIGFSLLLGTGLNGSVSSNIFRSVDAPTFYPGHGTVLAYMTLFLFCGSILQYYLLRSENRKRRRVDRDHWVEGLTPREIAQLGDRRPDFIYTL
ncbi:major facilitator superfamily domain-containing protein [Aspergillus leporis]|uniref:Major facilitator superfamily domain-containing protein n=1 Tax=Aspergillus leporis TaxID=41062 RepID=A0A5N5WHM5_9EURO|nr:major facilitator superfamily domain-containing protein [Aspergillus leporis]